MTLSDERIAELASAAYEAGTRGQFAPMDGCMPRLVRDGRPLARAWILALNGLRWHAEPAGADLPALADFESHQDCDRNARLAALRAAGHVAHASALAADAPRMAAWLELMARLNEAQDLNHGSLLHLFYEAWFELGRGSFDSAEANLRSLPRRAAEVGLAALVIDATALHALVLSCLGRMEESLSTARRASRMARAEDVPQPQYLANLVLARVRRLTGRPYLTTRIVRALLRVVPASWRGVLGWELLLAGGARTETRSEGKKLGPIHLAAEALELSIHAAREGQTTAFERHSLDAAEVLGHWQPYSAELAEVLTGLDPGVVPGSSGTATRDWCIGISSVPPPALRGLCTWLGPSPVGPAAYVHASPGTAARRIVGMAAPLANVERTLNAPRRGQGRVETALATLALAGADGLTRADLFRRIYGFDYVHGRHEGLFRVLIHRARNELSDLGSIESEGDRMRIELCRAVLIPDPRCEPPVENLALHFLAEAGGEGTKATALGLDISLRNAQLALTRLTEEGAVVMVRSGRNVTYRVEDTTFQEPTRFRR